MDTIFMKHLFLVWCRVYADFYLIENFSGEDCTYVCYAQLWIMRYNLMNSWKVNFCRPRCVWSKFDLCFYPEGICSETGLKYNLAIQNEVGMHITSWIENKAKPGYIL